MLFFHRLQVLLRLLLFSVHGRCPLTTKTSVENIIFTYKTIGQLLLLEGNFFLRLFSLLRYKSDLLLHLRLDRVELRHKHLLFCKRGVFHFLLLLHVRYLWRFNNRRVLLYVQRCYHHRRYHCRCNLHFGFFFSLL